MAALTLRHAWMNLELLPYPGMRGLSSSNRTQGMDPGALLPEAPADSENPAHTDCQKSHGHRAGGVSGRVPGATGQRNWVARSMARIRWGKLIPDCIPHACSPRGVLALPRPGGTAPLPFCRHWIDHLTHRGHLCSGKAIAPRMLLNEPCTIGKVDAKSLVVSDIAVLPLDVFSLRFHLGENGIGLVRRRAQGFALHRANSGNGSFNDISRHDVSSFSACRSLLSWSSPYSEASMRALLR